jgi:hypothetical protein
MLETRGLDKAMLSKEPSKLRELNIDCLSSLIIYLSGFDPHHPKKPWTQWLCMRYASDPDFRLEDASYIQDGLEALKRQGPELPVNYRDIQCFKTISDMLDVAEKYMDKPGFVSSREEERELRRLVMSETTILHQSDDGFTIAIPQTSRSSTWWGRGTRWRTAAEKTIFSNITTRHPLFSSFVGQMVERYRCTLMKQTYKSWMKRM